MRKILHVIDSLRPEMGGPSRIVSNLLTRFASDSEFRLEPLITEGLIARPGRVGRMLHDLVLLSYKGLFSESIECAVGSSALVHLHGMWDLAHFPLAKECQDKSIPYVVQPRGMMEPWALAQKKLKKKIGCVLFQNNIISKSSVLIATSRQEARSIRSFYSRAEIAVVPNSTSFPLIKNARLANRRSIVSRTLNLFFFGRIHEKKNLIGIVDAIGLYSKFGLKVELRIAGSDETGHLRKVFSRARNIGIASNIKYLGMLCMSELIDQLTGCDLVLAPSFSENFGNVVLESLSQGVPVVVSNEMPWSVIADLQAGFSTEPDASSIAGCLLEFAHKDELERLKMAQSALELAERFDVAAIDARLKTLYRWVLDGGVKPEFVYECNDNFGERDL